MALTSALATVTVGDRFAAIARLTHPLMMSYADRFGLDFIVEHAAPTNGLPVYYEKYAIFGWLARYERVLFLDTDVLVSPVAPNLLELVPPASFGAYLASEHSAVHDSAILKIQGELGDLGWRRTYFNSGVMAVSRCHKEVFDRRLGTFQSFGEQTQLNYNCRRLKVPVHDITYRFNHVQAGPSREHRADSAFIHYAGPGHRDGERRHQIAQDLIAFSQRHEGWRDLPDGLLEACRATLSDSPIPDLTIVPLTIGRVTDRARFSDAAVTELYPVEQIVMQPTSFCNIDCKYCYLPDRSSRKRMSIETATRAFSVLGEAGLLADRLECRWHAGEPLVVPVSFYRAALDEIRRLTPNGTTVWHSVQTNGTLIDDAWISFFRESGMRVGLSIDGPAFLHDRNRLRRNGEGTHAAAIRGAALLRDADIPFDVIAVITPASLDYPDEIFEFFVELGARSVGFNIEESEGSHVSKLLDAEEYLDWYRAFLERVYTLQAKSPLIVREIDEMQRVVLSDIRERCNFMVQPMAVLAMDCDGNLTTFSPELLGLRHEHYGNFMIANVWSDSADEIRRSIVLHRMAKDVRAGVESCRSSCEYFMLCGGGAPSNKLYENGAFDSTETGYCRARIKIPADIVIEHLERANAGGYA